MKYIAIILFIFIAISCSKEPKTDSELLAKDKADLAESLQSYKVTTYKFGKIMIRASVATDTISPEYQAFKTDLNKISKLIFNIGEKGTEDLSVLDYISIYRDYKKMEDYIAETDEDIFPTLAEVFALTYDDAQLANQPFAKGTEKEYSQNIEHSILSAIVLLSKDLGKEVSLYECSKTKPDLFPDTELKTLLMYYRGFLYFEKGFYYLSEDEYSRNITWLNEHPDVDLPDIKSWFKMADLNNEQTHIAFRSMNHLFRGFDRLAMDRDIDKERALEDFEKFLKGSKEVGIDNEMIWAVEIYMYLHNGEKDKAIASLTKLKSSKLLSAKDKKSIEESIAYLKEREAGELLNGAYDKFFLGKIASKYMLSVLAEVDWQKVLEENDVPHTKEMFETIEKFQDFIATMDTYTSEDKLKEIGKEAGKELKNQGNNLWDKANELLE